MIRLKDWQKVVLDLIEEHEDLVNSEEYVSLSDYSKNDLTKIKISLPRGSGHTFLVSYLAVKKSAVIIYRDLEHYHIIRKYIDDIVSKEKETYDVNKTVFLSVFELYHMLAEKDESNINRIKNKMQDKEVIVIDGASKLLPGIEEFSLHVSRGKVLLLD